MYKRKAPFHIKDTQPVLQRPSPSRMVLLVAISLAACVMTACSKSPDTDTANSKSDNMFTSHLTLIPEGVPKSWEESRQQAEKEKQAEAERTKVAREKAEAILFKPFQKYPESFAVQKFPNSDVYFSRESESWKQHKTKLVMLTSPEPYEKIARFYNGQLKAGGWKVVSVTGNGAYAAISATRDNTKMHLTVYIDLYQGERLIQIETVSKV